MPKKRNAKKPSTTAAKSETTPLPPRDERRAELVEAAYAMIAEKGLEGIRTRDIAARAGVNISTLHYYFGTKEALLLAVVDHVRHTFMRRNGQAFATGEEGRDSEPSYQGETLRDHLRAAWRNFQQTPHLAVVIQELAVRAQRDPAAQGAFRALHTFWNGMVEEALRRSIERREARADLDPALAARIVTSFIIGATVQLGINAKAFDFNKVTGELERLIGARPRRQR